MKQNPRKAGESPNQKRCKVDLVRLYLNDIGRVDLLSEEEELLLARLVQRREHLIQEGKVFAKKNKIIQELHQLENLKLKEAKHGSHSLTTKEWAKAAGVKPSQLQQKLSEGYQKWGEIAGLQPNEIKRVLREGYRAKDRMIKANLRLVVAIAKKYQHRGMDLLDLVQEGSLGLEHAVEKFDPTRGFRLSTYSYWWIRQNITRAIATQCRTIRIPIHVTEKLNKIKRIQHEITMKHGRIASIKDLAQGLGMKEETIRQTLLRIPRSISLDKKIGNEDNIKLGDLIPDGKATPEEKLTQNYLHQDLEILLKDLNPREATVIRHRFGLGDESPKTLTQIGTVMNLSRERVRQLEAKALSKLRQPQARYKVMEYIQNLDT